MPGGSLQLVAYGAQDLYITAKPQVTYWKTVHKRHTLYAIEPIKQEINGTVGFGKKFTIQIAKNGDLVHRVMLEVQLPDLTKVLTLLNSDRYEYFYVEDIGLALFKSIELDIGGQRLEKHTSEWMDSWLQLTTPDSKKKGLEMMMNGVTKSQLNNSKNKGSAGLRLFIPLQFFFNRHAGQALPLVSLTFHDIKIHVELRNFLECIKIREKGQQNTLALTQEKALYLLRNGVNFTQEQLIITPYADMVFLDTVERNFFATKEHEYLIELVQYLGQEELKSTIDRFGKRLPIPFINPVKELIWVFSRDSDNINGVQGPLEYCDIMSSMKLIINGNERFSKRDGRYFKLIQPWDHHTSIPDKHVYCYSFALTPQDNQPSGTCNFSKIESAYMQLEFDWEKYLDELDVNGKSLRPDNFESQEQPKTAWLHVFAMSYNILRIKNGLANLDYHN